MNNGCILSIVNILQNHYKEKHRIDLSYEYITLNSNTNIIIGKLIGSGGFSNIYDGTINNKIYCIKI